MHDDAAFVIYFSSARIAYIDFEIYNTQKLATDKPPVQMKTAIHIHTYHKASIKLILVIACMHDACRNCFLNVKT